MPHVAALYRYPIKGFDPQTCTELTVQADGRIAGDRVLAFRHADATTSEDDGGLEHWPKGGGLCVRDYPALTRLHLEYRAPGAGAQEGTSDSGAANDPGTGGAPAHGAEAASAPVAPTAGPGTVRLSAGGELLVEAGLDAAGRQQLAEAVTTYLLDTPDGARLRRAGHLPLTLVGDGRTARFQDRARGYVTVHSRSSLEALEGAVGMGLDEVRFRSNIAVEGWPRWSEEQLIGAQIHVGEVPFAVGGPIIRCAATHANPATGLRDARVMTTLTRTLGKAEPAFGLLLTAAGPGRIRVGDELRLST